MGKLLILFLASFALLSSCDEGKVIAPAIGLDGVYINGDTTVNYMDSLQTMPALKAGDEVEVRLILDGKGSSLNSLNVTSDHADVVAILVPSMDTIVAADTNFTDLEKGRMSFVDGVMNCKVTSMLRVVSPQEAETRLSFHLSARAECEAGGLLNLVLKTSE